MVIWGRRIALHDRADPRLHSERRLVAGGNDTHDMMQNHQQEEREALPRTRRTRREREKR